MIFCELLEGSACAVSIVHIKVDVRVFPCLLCVLSTLKQIPENLHKLNGKKSTESESGDLEQLHLTGMNLSSEPSSTPGMNQSMMKLIYAN